MRGMIPAYGYLNVLQKETMKTIAKEIYKYFSGLNKIKLRNE